jgi:uncharacterized lipoprotein
MKRTLPLLAFLSIALVSGCSSSPAVKTEAYAKLSNTRTFEYELPVVWKGIEASLHEFKIDNRDPEDVDPSEMRKLTKRSLETDWIFGQSRDKYVEYKVNGSPRKKYLQMRFKYQIRAESGIGGTTVVVRTFEQIEKLKADGTPDGYSTVDSDPSRPSELLEKINNAILSSGT